MATEARGTPRVSVIIPVYNLGAFVGDAIESALTQTLPPGEVEVVVVDDGSTDGSSEVVERYVPRVRHVRQPNRGLSAARNAGIGASSAPFLTFLDADDRLLPDKLAVQLEVFASRPEIGGVYTGWHYIDQAGNRLPERGWSRHEGDLFPQLVLGNLIHPHAVLVRREAVERAGGFDESLTSLEDWDLWLRLSRDGILWACIDRPLAEYRIRPNAMHQNPARMAENAIRVLDKLFAAPDLPVRLVAYRPAAYQSACLVAAADHYRAGDHEAGARWFQRAALARPPFLTEPRSLRRFCRLLLPPECQSRQAEIDEWPRLAATLRTALRRLFHAPGLEPGIARLRWQAALAYWRTVVPLALRHAWRPRPGRRTPPHR